MCKKEEHDKPTKRWFYNYDHRKVTALDPVETERNHIGTHQRANQILLV